MPSALLPTLSELQEAPTSRIDLVNVMKASGWHAGTVLSAVAAAFEPARQLN